MFARTGIWMNVGSGRQRGAASPAGVCGEDPVDDAVAMRDRSSTGLRVPLGITIPALGGLTAVAQLAFIQWQQLLLGLLMLGAGSAIYLLRNRYHQPEQHAELEHKVSVGDTPGVRAVGGRKKQSAAAKQRATS